MMHKIADKKYYSQRIEKVKTSSMRESLSGKHVLLAEDNDLNAEICSDDSGRSRACYRACGRWNSVREQDRAECHRELMI